MIGTVSSEDGNHIQRSFYLYALTAVINGTGVEVCPFDIVVIGQINLAAGCVWLNYGSDEQIRAEHVFVSDRCRGPVIREFIEQTSHKRLPVDMCLIEEFPDIRPEPFTDIDVLGHDAFDFLAVGPWLIVRSGLEPR